MTQLYVKAWFLWVVVVVLILVGSVSAFSYIESNILKTFLQSEKESHGNTKQSLTNVIYTLNQTSLNLSQKTTELMHTYNKITSLSIENYNVTTSLKDTKGQWNETVKELNILYNASENLTNKVNLLKNVTLYNPTYDEVIIFIEDDKTDENVYKGGYVNEILRSYIDYYVCLHFSSDLIYNAVDKGIRCGYVDLTFYNVTYDTWGGHVIVAFDTVDSGVIFVEPQNDEIRFDLYETGYYDALGYPYWIYDLTITWLGK